MKVYTFRLKHDEDLGEGIQNYAKEHDIQAGFIITCVAGVSHATLRMADAQPDHQDIRKFEGPLEVVSLVGTVTATGKHLHASVADKKGNVFGGHLKAGTPVHTTAEVVIGEDEAVVYDRELDEDTKFTELVVRPRS